FDSYISFPSVDSPKVVASIQSNLLYFASWYHTESLLASNANIGFFEIFNCLINFSLFTKSCNKGTEIICALIFLCLSSSTTLKASS
ncbi:hypothetical protein CP02DC14_1692A, partial [Chlamydia psittaci 02DC14]